MVEALYYKLGGLVFDSQWDHRIHFSIYLILPTALDPGVYWASKRNEYSEIFLGLMRDQRVRLTIWPLSVSWLSRQCDILDISECYRPSRPITGIALLFFFTFIVLTLASWYDIWHFVGISRHLNILCLSTYIFPVLQVTEWRVETNSLRSSLLSNTHVSRLPFVIY
jgi:hypothetical protein